MDVGRMHYDINTLLPSNDSRFFSPEEIDAAINFAVLNLFNQQFKAFGETQRVSDALDRFKVTTPVPLVGLPGTTAAVGVNPPNNIHTLNVLGSKLGTMPVQRKGKIVEEQFLAQYIDSEAFAPDENHVVFRFVGPNIQVYPNTFTEIRVTHFRKPIDCKWAYTYTGLLQNIPVYDALNSVQIDYTDTAYDQVLEKSLMYLGQAQKDGSLLSFQQVAKNNSIPEVR
jgi:hypothetical protein